MKGTSLLAICVFAWAATALGADPIAAPKPARSPQSQSFPTPEGVTDARDLVYARPGGKSLKLDIYYRAELVQDKKLPLVVWIHGGGWRSGDKMRPEGVDLFTRAGYVMASIDYRLLPDHIFPAQIEDCKAAIRWLRANAEKYHVDPERIGVWGPSAGGHLVALLGMTSGSKDFDVGDNLDVSNRVQAVADWYGPANFKALAGNPKRDDLFGGPINDHLELAAKASPLTYVRKDAPPILIMHGDKDASVPLSQSEEFAAALKKAGADVTFQIEAGAGHGFRTPTQIERVKEFFDEKLKPAKKPE